MTRVSENSSLASINFSVGKTKQKLEDLQIKGSHLKRIGKPSDDPIGNIRAMNIKGELVDNTQFRRNSQAAVSQLNFAEDAFADMTELLSKAKEIGISQASDYYDINIRSSIAKEIGQIKNQMLSIANKRVGNRYIFSGHKSLQPSFNAKGDYMGDNGQTRIEVAKDIFIPVNITGSEAFFLSDKNGLKDDDPLAALDKKELIDVIGQGEGVDLEKMADDVKKDPLGMMDEGVLKLDQTAKEIQQRLKVDRKLASVDEGNEHNAKAKWSVFHALQSLEDALLTSNTRMIQDLLPEFDKFIDQMVFLRTKVGSYTNSIKNAEMAQDKTEITMSAEKSKLEDADVMELFSDLSRQENALKASYKASSGLLNLSLMDYLK